MTGEIFMPDQQATTQPAPQISGAFNQVSPKIIKLSDLQIQLDAFEKINGLNFVERMLIDAEMRVAGQNVMKSDGRSVYVDTKPGLFSSNFYIDARLVTDTVVALRTDPKLNEKQRAFLDKLDDTIEQAVQACPDQSPKLKAGAIRPFKR